MIKRDFTMVNPAETLNADEELIIRYSEEDLSDEDLPIIVEGEIHRQGATLILERRVYICADTHSTTIEIPSSKLPDIVSFLNSQNSDITLENYLISIGGCIK